MFHRKLISRQGTGHPAGQRSILAKFRFRLAVADEHISSGRGRRRFTSVNRHERSVAAMNQDKTAAANPGIVSIHHTQHQRDRHCT